MQSNATHIHDDIHFEHTVFDIFYICGNNDGKRHMCAKTNIHYVKYKNELQRLKYFIIKTAFEFDFIVKFFHCLNPSFKCYTKNKRIASGMCPKSWD